MADSKAPPPPYGSRTDPVTGLEASFDNFGVKDQLWDLSEDTCLVHLKLLQAFHLLKEEVGYTDGLFGLWNRSAEGGIVLHEKQETLPSGRNLADASESQLLALSKIREKRWALYVARAVDRYEAWWKSIEGTLLTVNDMLANSQSAYLSFTETTARFEWADAILPPLGMACPRLTSC